MAITLPNIRRLFIPDPGYFIASVDLAGADAQVVAWEAEDEDLKAAFRAGIPIHQKNAEDMFGKTLSENPVPGVVHAHGDHVGHDHTGHHANGDVTPRQSPGNPHIATVFWPGRGNAPKHPKYQNCKQGIHATNYGVSTKTLAITLGWTIATTSEFMRKWFSLHPNIPDIWHEKVEHELQTKRQASNRFGYRRVYFDRISGLLPEALAWGPQSTVAITCNKGGVQLRRNLPWIDVLLQVHDELVIQFPWRYEDKLTSIRDCLEVEIPYDDPLIIPWKLSMSRKSWGDCEGRAWE